VGAPTVDQPSTDGEVSNQQAIDGLQTVSVDPGFLSSLDPNALDGDPPQIYLRYTTTAPTAGVVADLRSGDPIGPDAEWVLLDAGLPLWLDLGSLSATDRASVVTWLDAAGGSVRLDGRTLVIGDASADVTFSADTEDPQTVLDAANGRRDQDAAVWWFLNAGSSALEANDADPTGWQSGQTKPGAWYNGYTVTDGQVDAHRSDFDTRKGEPPALDLDGLKALIMRTMDVGGVRDALGDDHDTFVEALRQRFGAGHPVGEQGFVSLCDELWSYLQTGAGPDGEVDIGRLQAVVRALSPDTEATAETNTPFTGEAFTLDGSDVSLNRGDGVFGRATMMSLMHLFGSFVRTVHEPNVVGLVPAAVFDDSDVFVRDRSGSMVGTPNSPGKWPLVRDAVDQSQGWGPGQGIETRTVATFDQNDTKVGAITLTDMQDALDRAYAILYPDDTRDDRRAFAELFDLDRGDIFTRDGLDTSALTRLLGDGAGVGFGAVGESPLKAMLLVLTHPEALPVGSPLRTRLELGSGDPSSDPVRLNGVADEPEQSPEYLRLVTALAEALGVDARIVFVPTRGADYAVDPVGNLLFVDLEDIVVNDDNTATVTYTQGGSERTDTVPISGAGTAGSPGRYQGSKLDLGTLQRVEGLSE
jgi:hypothetical protein